MEVSRGQLTREKIAESGAALLNEVGLDGLSMRKLGAKLGVEAMSLYNHVKNKADLLDAVHGFFLLRMTQELAAKPPVEGWKNAARNMTLAFLHMLKSNPKAIPLFASRSAIAPGALSVMDQAVEVLLRAGFTPRESINAFQTFFALTLGHAIFHYGRRGEDSFASTQAYQEYQHLAEVGDPNARTPDEEFEFGLEALLSGLESRLIKRV